MELSGRSPAELQVNRFNIRQLHHQKHIFSCSAALYLLCHGLADYIELNQAWWLPSGAEIPVKTYLNVNLDEHEQTGEVILFSKRNNEDFESDTLFKPLEIGLSSKAKASGFDIKEYFRLFDHDSSKKNIRIEEIQSSKYRLSCNDSKEQTSIAITRDSSYSQSPPLPSISPSNSPTFNQCDLNMDHLLQPQHDFLSDINNVIPVSELNEIENSLSFLESLSNTNDTDFSSFNDLYSQD